MWSYQVVQSMVVARNVCDCDGRSGTIFSTLDTIVRWTHKITKNQLDYVLKSNERSITTSVD